MLAIATKASSTRNTVDLSLGERHHAPSFWLNIQVSIVLGLAVLPRICTAMDIY